MQRALVWLNLYGREAFFVGGDFEFFFQKINKMLDLNENKQPVNMRYPLFLHYGWFLQHLGKDFNQTNMHMTVEEVD